MLFKERINTLVPESFAQRKKIYLSLYNLCRRRKLHSTTGLPVGIYLPFAWAISSFLLIILVITSLTLTLTNSKPKHTILYSTFSSKPYVLGVSDISISSDDPRVAKMEKIFEKYNCPIKGYGKSFVREADKNNIPYWLVASIAFQESSCGKQTPKKDGVETNNLYGWGVWGENIKKFDSIDHGIEVVSKYMKDSFFSRGIIKPCDIMKTYTPPSKGSWCDGVEFFKDEIDNYTSP